MREILFRGKSVNDGRWVFGDLSNYGVCKTITTMDSWMLDGYASIIIGNCTNGSPELLEGDKT